MRHKKFRLWVVLITLNLMNFGQIVEAAVITPATSPLANISGDVVRPNILYVLDNSGSMRWDYLPDYVSDGTSTTGSQICWNGTNNTNTLSTCRTGTTSGPTDSGDMTTSAVEVPVTTPDINYIYYNPATYYQLPIKADGTNYPNSTVTAAYTDGFALSGSTNLKDGTTVTSSLSCTPASGSTTVTCAAGTEGLTGTFVTSGTGVPSGAYVTATPTATTLTLSVAATSNTASNWTFKTGTYPHQVYCNTGSPTAQNLRGNGTVCKETTDTVALGSTDLYPSSTFSTVKSYNGAPYYYSMSAMEYCTDSFFTSCSPTLGGAFTFPALYRWCTSNAYTDCVDLRNSTHTVPDYLGTFPPSVLAARSYADLTVNSNIAGKSITGLTINGVGVIAAGSLPITATTASTTTTLAQSICTAINANSVTSGYDCTIGPVAAVGATPPSVPSAVPALLANQLRIKAKVPPTHADYETPNGYLVQVNGPAVAAGVNATGTITVTDATAGKNITAITINGNSLLSSTITATGSTTGAATAICNAIGVGPSSSKYTCSVAGSVVTITRAATNIDNGQAINITGTAPVAPASATGTIAIPAGATRVNDITVNNGVTNVSVLTTKPYFFGDGSTAAANCTALAAQVTTAGFTASCAGANMTLTAPSGVTTYNGRAIIMTGTASQAKATLTATADVLAATTALSGASIGAITVGATSLRTAQNFAAGTLKNAVATQIASGMLNGFSGSATTNVVTVTAPVGVASNGQAISVVAGGAAAVKATGSIVINSTAGATIISDITVGGVSVLSPKPLNYANGTLTTAIATDVASKIGGGSYTATATGSTVNITAVTAGAVNPALAVSAAGGVAGSAGTKATATITISGTPKTAAGGGTNVTIGPITEITGGTCAAPVGPTTIMAGTAPNTSTSNTALTRDTAMATSVAAAAFSGGFTRSSGGAVVTITQPAVGVNTQNVCATKTAFAGFTVTPIAFSGGSNPIAAITVQSTTVSGMSGGLAGVTDYDPSLTTSSFPSATTGAAAVANAGYNAASSSGINMNNGGVVAVPGTITTTTTNMSNTGALPTGPIDTNASATPSTLTMLGGLNPSGGSRVNVGKFTRVDIVPSTTSYPKASGRDDCAGASCTYAEELQNFANWYSFYRSRMLLMKTTSTLAFDELDSKYRVGFDLLSNYGSNNVSVQVSQFVDSGGETANQRTTWWSNLTAADGNSGTPLRSALLKAGKYYGGKLTSSAGIPAIPETPAKGYLDISSSTSDGATITTVKVEGVEILGSTFTVSGCAGSCNGTERTTVATNLANAIAAHIALPAYTGPLYVISSTSYTSGGSTVGRVVITAPAAVAPALATDYNGADLTASKTGTLNLGVIDFGSGVDATPAVPATIIEPVQYSCQQNFTLLVTDGYWNTDSYTNLTKLGGTALTNEDNTNVAGTYTVRPSYDGVVASTACTDSAVSSCGTLADIAMYYYQTDIRDASLSNDISGDTGLDVATNNVFKSPTDDNQQQHMVLFTMALGAPGTLRYSSDYPDATSGDFYDIKTTNANPLLQKNWPPVKANDPATIDDLWHAAVNGRGKYFSARDPQSVVDGLTEALASVQVREGAAAAAATSNLQPIAGDNFAYVASYTTNEWSGDLQARIISTTTGAVSEPANAVPNDCVSDSGCPWSAQKKLESKVWSARNIYMAPASGSTLRLFTYANLTAPEKAFFNPAVGDVTYGTGPLSQYASVFATDPTEITDVKMTEFLRGDTSLEVANTGGLAEVWRDRKHVLGDIVNTQPTFVKKTVSTTYEDSGYSTFITDQSDREGVVYVSGNDGMLHAFASDDFFDGTASGGEELWAFIPTQALPYLRYLADTNYVHRYYVDGPIAVSDVNFGGGASDWHTILVAGLGSGGNAYFALDITDPVNPKFLWEFTDANLGLTYGNPSMNKLPNGEWAVLFSSGYNNADGKGYLYALDVETGAIKTGYPLTTNSGNAASPSNLGKIAAWVDNLIINNTATDVYAGDMDGDLWRFDLTTKTVSRLAHLTDAVTPTPNAQPITTRPELTRVDGNRVIYVGTGRYLGLTDPYDLSVQSFYAIKDTDASPSPDWNTPRTETGTINGVPGTPMFIQRKLIALKNNGSQITRTAASGATVDARQICTGINSEVDSSTGDCINETGGTIDWAQYGGWYFDLPDSGERMNVDMNLTLGTLTIPSNVPASSSCTSGGYGWVNYVDFKTGLEVDTGTMIVSEKIANALIVGLNVIKVGDKLVAIVTTSDFEHGVAEPPGAPGQFKGKRDLWRELDPY